MKKALLLAPILVLSANAFAWHGGERPTQEPKIPADTTHNPKTTLPNGDVIVEGNFSNRKGDKDLVCDIFGQVDGKRGGDSVTLVNYVDGRVVKAFRSFADKFLFELSEAGPGYKLDKASQKYEASCLIPDAGESPSQNPDQNPKPHESCDPEYEKCDWTCPAQSSNPDQCASEDW